MTGAPLPPTDEVHWAVVVPVQDAARAKTRLQPPHPLSRPDLARAVARDTLEQVCGALSPRQVVVVTSDDAATATARELGAVVVPDPGRGLNAAVEAGLARSRARAARGVRGVRPGWAVLLGDLPALRSADLVQALLACSVLDDAVVPDADGTGTVLLTSTLRPPTPRFGPGSAAAHARSATLLDLDLPRLRRDVDTADDLAQALALGVGRHTSSALGQGWVAALS